jgi:hypothetical protein
MSASLPRSLETLRRHASSKLLLRAALLSFVAVTLATYCLGPLERSQWAIQDDHEIAFYAGPTGRLSFWDIPRTLAESEIGSAGRIARFRPSFMGLRLLEVSLWGFAPTGWFRTRMVLYSVSVFLVGWVVAARIGIVGAVGVLVWVLSAGYWFDVWGRLGVAESYSAFGCALWAFGIHLLWSGATPSAPVSRYRLAVGILLFVLGNAVAVGGKETLLILVVPNLILAIVEIRSGRRGGVRSWACLANMLVAVAVATPLLIYFAAKPVDVYGNSVGVRRRVAVLALGAKRLTILHDVFIVAVALWLGTRALALARIIRPSAAWCRLTFCLVLASLAALTFFLAQFVLYNGDITPNTHYQFPAALAVPALLVVISLYLRDYFRRTGALLAERAVYNVSAGVFLGLALLSLQGFREQREHSQGWAAATRDFTTRITAAAAMARAHHNVPIVVLSGRPLDYEPIVSVERFLQALGASNPWFLVLDWDASRQQWTELEIHLAPGVEQLAREGGLGFQPASQLDPAAPCLSIGLSHEPRQGCRSLGRLWQ